MQYDLNQQNLPTNGITEQETICFLHISAFILQNSIGNQLTFWNFIIASCKKQANKQQEQQQKKTVNNFDANM